MTVKELIAELSAMNPDAVVVLQKDSEGNGYSPLSGADDALVYIAESTWAGEVRYVELTEELESQGYSEEDCAEEGEGVPCVILFPIY